MSAMEINRPLFNMTSRRSICAVYYPAGKAKFGSAVVSCVAETDTLYSSVKYDVPADDFFCLVHAFSPFQEFGSVRPYSLLLSLL